MASAESQKPTCPVCSQADQVKTTEAAYEAGVARCAPPDLPTRHVSMFKYMMTGIFIVGICVFFIVVLIGGLGEGINIVLELILVSITLICIIAALVLSFLAFRSVVRGDAEATKSYPAWDQAMERWRSLDYCSRDDVVFDPKARKVLTEAQLTALRSMDGPDMAQKSAMLAQH